MTPSESQDSTAVEALAGSPSGSMADGSGSADPVSSSHLESPLGAGTLSPPELDRLYEVPAAPPRRAADTLPKHKLRVPRPRRADFQVLVGTRKGVFALQADRGRTRFERLTPSHLGWTCFHVMADPRNRRTLLAAVRDPEGRATVIHSRDGGASWLEADEPPRFETEPPFEVDGDRRSDGAREVRQVFWLTPGHSYHPGRWYCGTSPQGLFITNDGGRTWSPMNGLHRHPGFDEWTLPGRDRTPDGAKLHSVLLDPRDPDHLYLGLSSGGVLESIDGGEGWSRLDGGLEGDHARDPHALTLAPTNPDRLWMQTHFGVYRMDREEGLWQRVGPRDEEGGWRDAGFPIVVHPSDPDCAWVFPMDGSKTWSRMPLDGRPALYRTLDGGRTWARQERGFPVEPCYWTVKRQCLAVDGCDPLGLYFGTTSGDVWASFDEGQNWTCIARGLPHIYSVEIG